MWSYSTHRDAITTWYLELVDLLYSIIFFPFSTNLRPSTTLTRALRRSRRNFGEITISLDSYPPDRSEFENPTTIRRLTRPPATRAWPHLLPPLLSLFSSPTPPSCTLSRSAFGFSFQAIKYHRRYRFCVCEKLTGTTNYNICAGGVKIWFRGQGYEDPLTKKSDSILAAKCDKWIQTNASLSIVLWFSIATNLQARYKAFTTYYEVWKKAKKIFSNDVHNLYSAITKLNSLKLENMDMQAYLSKLDALKTNFTTLIPFTKYATTYDEQQSKYFMIVALS